MVLQREKLRESFKRDSDAPAGLNGSMEDAMGLSDATQRSNSEFAASASSKGAPTPGEESAAALHEVPSSHAATSDSERTSGADSHSSDSSHVDVGGSIDDVGAAIR